VKNNIEEDIKILETLDYLLDDVYSTNLVNDEERNKYQYAIEHILSDYKRVLKENEELKNQEATQRKINELLVQRYSNSISVQKVKDKIEQYKKMLLSCNRFSDAERIKAINERILELEELLKGRKQNVQVLWRNWVLEETSTWYIKIQRKIFCEN